MAVTLLAGDCRDVLATLPAGSAQCCVTSPPYFGLRDYGVSGQIGLEPTPDAYVAELVAVFREVRRVLADDGTVFLNLGDSYAQGGSGGASSKSTLKNDGRPVFGARAQEVALNEASFSRKPPPGLKPKDLIGIPWRVAFALQADGWYLRSDIIWHKPNPMPESVRDRPTKAHEYVFLLSKQERYFYDAAAIAEAALQPVGNAKEATGRGSQLKQAQIGQNQGASTLGANAGNETRNARTVWTITPKPFRGAHFATFPPALAERCIKAGSRPGDTVLDPFAGAGTTLMVAAQLGRSAVGVELNPAYAAMAEARLHAEGGMFYEVAACLPM